MSDLRWSWLGAPYVACAVLIFAVGLAASLVRGDRVLRLGVIGAAISAVPWAICQAFAAFTTDPVAATRVLRVGHAPIAATGPCLLLLLLGVSGQLEPNRWIVRVSGLFGVALMIVAWATPWVVPGVQRLPSGMFYVRPGPLTALHLSQLAIWLALGLLIARRSSPRAARRGIVRLLIAVFVGGAIGSVDLLLVYGLWGVYPVAWLPTALTAGIALYLVLRTDLLHPQGFDRAVAVELAAFALAIVAFVGLALGIGTSSRIALVVPAAAAWVVLLAAAWAVARRRPVRVAFERALEQFVARAASLDDADDLARRLASLWKRAIGIEVMATWRREGRTARPEDAFVEIGGGRRWTIDPEVVAWLVAHGEALAMSDLATMRVGEIRPRIEALGALHAAELIVPLVDRGELVGLVEGHYTHALREADRGLIVESSRAAARALTFVTLSRAAARERETAREVEVADALRLQATASRDAELGRWAIAAEYRNAPRGAGGDGHRSVAGWSAVELADGRLAVLATESHAHGVSAALATAALTGAFAAATSEGVSGPGAAAPEVGARLTLDAVVEAMRASAEGLMRGGAPVAVFLAILDARTHRIEWACAGHPGGFLVGPIAAVDTGFPLGSGTGPRPAATPLGSGVRLPATSLAVADRGAAPLPPDTLLVVASTGLRGDHDAAWAATLREAAPASGRLATVLVDQALRGGEPRDDLLAVVVRSR